MKNLSKFKRWLIYLSVTFVGLFVAFFVVTSLSIGESVNKYCYFAQKEYGKDCVGSLIDLVGNDKSSFSDRNHAIWALGQLGDKRALEVLKKYYTGVIPEKEPYDKGISQHELKKAIKLLESDFNLSAFVWR